MYWSNACDSENAGMYIFKVTAGLECDTFSTRCKPNESLEIKNNKNEFKIETWIKNQNSRLPLM